MASRCACAGSCRWVARGWVTGLLTVALVAGSPADAAPCSGDDPFIVGVVNALCGLYPGGDGCLTQTDSCDQVQRELFTGVTLQPPSGGAPQWCGLGGRGQIIGEAALCLLRDLALPARAPSQGGPGITISTPAISLGAVGEASVTERVGFLSFDVPGRQMRGYHGVSLCLPAFGCVSDATQPFVATLRRTSPGEPTGLSCGDYPIGDAYGLDVVADDTEHTLKAKIPPIIVYTPYGAVSAEPQFDFSNSLKVVSSPYDSSNQVRAKAYDISPSCPGPVALLVDLYGRIPGVAATAGLVASGPPCNADPDGGAGWDSQVALGGRDADPASPLWTFDPLVPERPDLDQSQAREAAEKQFVGAAGAKIPISYSPTDLVPAVLRSYPFSLEFRLTVTPAVEAWFASQFNAYLSEASYWTPAPVDCGGCRIEPWAQVIYQNRADAKAGFSLAITFRFLLEVDLGFFDKTLIDINESVVPVTLGDRSSKDGPGAAARSQSVPPGAPTYSAFTSFSLGDVDGAQFVSACLSEPPPPAQELPQPSYDPGDPRELVPEAQYPCNLCVAYSGFTSVCGPKPGFPPDHPCIGINGPCTDASGENGCENKTLDPPLTAGQTVVFPVSQASLPPDKRWLCDSPAKMGCFDLCTYDAASQKLLTIVESAVDVNPAANCNGSASAPKVCSTDAFCDDGNPCTEDRCTGGGEFPKCEHTANDGAPCDDGLFCDGPDSCVQGACGIHAGNPCGSGMPCCNETSDSCLEACASTRCGNGILEFGEPCDDGNTTAGDGCSAACEVETGFVCSGQPSVCSRLAPTPTPTRTPTPTPLPVPVISSPDDPAGWLLIGILVALGVGALWRTAGRTTRWELGGRC